MNEQNDGIIEFGFSFEGVKRGVPEMISLVDNAVASVSASMARLNATNASGMGSGLMGMAGGVQTISMGLSAAEGHAGRLLTSLDRMSGLLTNQLGIGATIGGFALLERTFTTALNKAREFQTAQISIAAELSSVGRRTNAQGATVSPALGFQSNMRYAQDLQARLLKQSAENHLKFQEQLGAFQSALEPGVRKGLGVEQVFNLSNLGAMAAKSLGLHGEQIANATRLLLGGGVNVARSTVGRALGIQNEDITSRSGTQLSDFLTTKLKGFQEAQGEFGKSIEGVISTLESRVDVLLSKVGMRFFDKIKPTLQGLFAGSEEPVYQGGAGHTNETYAQYQQRVQTYMKASEQQNETIDALATGFNNLFKALMEIINSGAFQEFTKFLAFLAQYTDKILLGAVFVRIATAIKGASAEAAILAKSLQEVATAQTLVSKSSGGGGFTGTGSYGAGLSRANRRVGGVGTTAALEEGLALSLSQQAIKKEVESAYAARIKSMTPWAEGSMLGNGPTDIMAMAALQGRPATAKAREAQRLARNKAVMAAQAEESEMAAQAAMVAAAAQADLDRLNAAKQAELEMRLGQPTPNARAERMLAARREARQRAAHQSDLAYLGAQQPGLQGIIKDETKSEAERRAAMEHFKFNEAAMAKSTAFLAETNPWTRMRGNLAGLGANAITGISGYAQGVANKAMPGIMGLMLGGALEDTAKSWTGGAGIAGRLGGNLLMGGSAGYMFGQGKSGIGGGMIAGLGINQQEGIDKMAGNTGVFETAPGQQFINAKGWASLGASMLTGAGVGATIGSNFGGAPGAAVGAAIGTLVSPLISLKKACDEAADAAKMAAHNLDEMKTKFPHGVEMSDIESRYRASQAAIAQTSAPKWGKEGIGSWVYPSGVTDTTYSEQMKSLDVWKAREAKRVQTENAADKNFVSYWSNLTQRMEGTKEELQHVTDYGNTFADQQRKIALETQTKQQELEKFRSGLTGQPGLEGVTWAQNVKAIEDRIAKGRANVNGQHFNPNIFAISGTSPAEKAEAAIRAKLEANEETYVRNHIANVESRKVAATGTMQEQALGYTQAGLLAGGPLQEGTKKVFDTIGAALKEAADSKNMDSKKALVQQAINNLWDYFGQQVRSLHVEGLQLSSQQYAEGIKKEEYYHNLPYERRKLEIEQTQGRAEQKEEYRLKGVELGFQPAHMALNVEAMNLADKEAAIQAQEMSAKKEELSIRARQLTITQPLEAQKVQMEAGNAENAETLFYGGLGPITKVAAAIRYKVEAEYAGRFNPAEYEAAYRQKFENEIQEFQIAKTEAKEKVTELPEQQALDRKKADLEWLHAGQANLEAAHAAKERAQARKELPTKKSEYELELKKYGTEGALLQNSLGESATAVHFFNESVIAAGLAFAASGAAMANELNNHKRQAQMLRGGVETLQIKTKELGIHPALLVGNPLANPGAVKNLHEHERAMAYGVEHAQVSMIKEHKQAMAHTQSHTHTPEGHADLGNGMTVNVGPITIGGVQAPEQVSSSLKAAIQTGIEDWCQRQQRRSKV